MTRQNIDDIALDLLAEVVSDPIEYYDDHDTCLCLINQVRGIVDMTKAIKEFLNQEEGLAEL